MGRRKYLIQFTAMVVATITVTSCIKDIDTIEFRQRPTMVLDFQYLNVDSINTVNKEVEHIEVIVYNPEDSLFAQYHIKKSELIAHKGIIPLYGVPEGDYKVVCIANKTNINIQPATMVLTDGVANYSSNILDIGCDSLFMSLDTISVVRGRPYPKITLIDLHKKFYMFDVEITGTKWLNRPKGDIRLQVVGVPNGFDFKGYFAEEIMIIKPTLDYNIATDLMTKSFALNEFNYKSNVIIEVFDRQEKIGSFDLKRKIIDEKIDLNVKDLRFKVRIEIVSIGSSLVVKDWDLNPVKDEGIGK